MKLYIAAGLIASLSGPIVAASPSFTDDHIRRVQEGVVPPVLVTGESPAIPSLFHRMSELKVPGVSIAVIHKGPHRWRAASPEIGPAELGSLQL